MINVNVSQPNDGLGDKLRDAFIIVNDNFNELFSLIDSAVNQTELDSAIDSINTQLNTIVTDINSDLTNILNILDTKSDIGHTHLISEISGLQTTLNSLVTSTTFNTQISSINSQIASINDLLLELQNVDSNLQDQIDNLQSQIDNIPPNDLQTVTDTGNTTATNIVANGGVEGSTDYSNFSLMSPYYNDMKWFRFYTVGDGTDFSPNQGCNFAMNPEEGIYIQRFDYDNNTSTNITFGNDTIYLNSNSSIGYGNIIVSPTEVSLRANGSFDAYLRNTNLTTQRSFEFPDEDGILSTREWVVNELAGLTLSSTLQDMVDSDTATAEWNYGLISLAKKYDGETRHFAIETSGDDGNVSSNSVSVMMVNPTEISLYNGYAGDSNSQIKMDNGLIELITNYEGGYNTKYRYFPDYIRIENQQLGIGLNYNCNLNIPFLEDSNVNVNLNLPLTNGTLATVENITMLQASTSPDVPISNLTGKLFDVNYFGTHRAILGGSQSQLKFYINRGSSDTVSIGGGRIEAYSPGGNKVGIETSGALRYTNTSGKETTLTATGTASDIQIQLPVNAGQLALVSQLSVKADTTTVNTTIASATASIYNNIVKQTVTNGVTSSCPSQDAVYDFVTAAIASATASIPSGSTPSLNQVLNVGNTTSNSIIFTDGSNSIDINPEYIEIEIDGGSDTYYSYTDGSSSYLNYTNNSNFFKNSSQSIDVDRYVVSVQKGIGQANTIDIRDTSFVIRSYNDLSIESATFSISSNGSNKAYLKNTNLTADRTYQFPNASGTFSLTGHTHSASDIIGLTIATPSLNDVLLVGATTSTAAEFRGGIYTNNGILTSGHFNIGDSLINGAFTHIDSLFKGDLSEENTVFKINYKENIWANYLDYNQDVGSLINFTGGIVQINSFNDNTIDNGIIDVNSDRIRVITSNEDFSSNIAVYNNAINLQSNEITFHNGTLGGNYLSISDSSDDVTISGNTGVKIKGLTGGLGLYSAVLKTHKLTNDRVFQFPNYSSELIGINTSNQLNLDIASMNIETSGDITFKSGNILTLGASIYFQLFNGTYNMILDMSSLTGDRQLNFTNANGLIPAFRSDLVPTSPTASGVVGEIRADNEYMYMCLDTNHWIRCATDGTWS